MKLRLLGRTVVKPMLEKRGVYSFGNMFRNQLEEKVLIFLNAMLDEAVTMMIRHGRARIASEDLELGFRLALVKLK